VKEEGLLGKLLRIQIIFIEIPLWKLLRILEDSYLPMYSSRIHRRILNIPKEIFDGLISDMFTRKGSQILENDLRWGSRLQDRS
jgi:2-oxoglutarate ferredoxin oxidoreductase subunit alpha